MDDLDKRLRRIENALRFLVNKVGFPLRNVWDGRPWEEQSRLAEQENKSIAEIVEKIMNGEKEE